MAAQRWRPPPLVDEALGFANSTTSAEPDEAEVVVKNTFLEVPGGIGSPHTADAQQRMLSGLSTAPASLQKIGTLQISLATAVQLQKQLQLQTPGSKLLPQTPSTVFEGSAPMTPLTPATASPSTPSQESFWPPTPSNLPAAPAFPTGKLMADATRTGSLSTSHLPGRLWEQALAAAGPLATAAPAAFPALQAASGANILATGRSLAGASPPRGLDAARRAGARWADIEDDDGAREDGSCTRHPQPAEVG
eukprot:CAMPEP_0168424618 /NCGR_PEP_ID=MMETSP0228-20121227/34912_1 /TAXON_ID=133427 /ORGANISM="Protoceratium reticulatum, Strain CCCM 535 (=CCMP 1889)" /LENGTH=249 /DNA_ID=CAMNT_0008438607 /DNA_START=73 /DNA_END=819 /DNA_ORIENTATION=+